jgi:hypothetical protein
VVLGLLVYASYGFKSSVGMQFAAIALPTAGLWWLLAGDGQRGRNLGIAAALAALAIAADLFLLRGSAHRTILIEPFNAFERALDLVGLHDLPATLYALAYPVYVLASFGVRAAGFLLLPEAVGRRSFNPVVFFLLAFSVSGFLLTELVVIESPNAALNQAYSFSMQSLMASWLLLPLLAEKLRLRGTGLVAAGVVVLLLAAPSSAHLYRLKYSPWYFSIGPEEQEVVRHLETTPPDSVVLHPMEMRFPSLAAHLAGRQAVISPYFAFLADWADMDELKRRVRDVSYFFDTSESPDRAFVLKRYHVDYVYLPASLASSFLEERALIPILSNRKYVLFRVRQ